MTTGHSCSLSERHGSRRQATHRDPGSQLLPGLAGDQFHGYFPSGVPLQAGKVYYMEGLYKEEGGGDYIRVAAA